MNYKNILIVNLLTFLSLGLVLFLISLFFVTGRIIFSKKKKNFSSKLERISYTLVAPLILLFIAIYINYRPVTDYIAPNYKISEGILMSISNSSKNPIQYSIKMNNIIYYIPRKVKNPNNLVKNKVYKIICTANRTVVNIEEKLN